MGGEEAMVVEKQEIHKQGQNWRVAQTTVPVLVYTAENLNQNGVGGYTKYFENRPPPQPKIIGID